MPTEWERVYNAVIARVRAANGGTLFFRGHRDVKWQLAPGLARRLPSGLRRYDSALKIERTLHFQFTTRAGDLLPESESRSWRSLFTMQHHGMPTRLLDWTQTFAIALHFALQNANDACAVWLMSPYELNGQTLGQRVLIDAHELEGSYEDYYVHATRASLRPILAISPFGTSRRILQQRSAFTLHDDLEHPLEDLYPDLVTKFTFTRAAFAEAHEFLTLAGVTEFALFPDLDGLSREICQQVLGVPD